MPRDEWIKGIYQARLPNAIYTIDIRTGEVKECYHENEWLGHVQFSPADPALLEFCHEGPAWKPERMWLVRTDGTAARKLYTKTDPHELLTHEFWSPDGARVWFDFQTPRLLKFLLDARMYLAWIDAATGQMTKYHLKLQNCSWHYNISTDGKLLCGDGEGRYTRLCPSARWIFLYHPDGGNMRADPLCNMARHSYTVAPGAHFTPDGKWVVFRADFTGTSQVYAVEVKRL